VWRSNRRGLFIEKGRNRERSLALPWPAIRGMKGVPPKYPRANLMFHFTDLTTGTPTRKGARQAKMDRFYSSRSERSSAWECFTSGNCARNCSAFRCARSSAFFALASTKLGKPSLRQKAARRLPPTTQGFLRSSFGSRIAQGRHGQGARRVEMDSSAPRDLLIAFATSVKAKPRTDRRGGKPRHAASD
jgi:hypothetical protein